MSKLILFIMILIIVNSCQKEKTYEVKTIRTKTNTYKLIINKERKPDLKRDIIFTKNTKYNYFNFNKGTSNNRNHVFKQYLDCATDKQGNIFIPESKKGMIRKFDKNGKFLFAVGRKGKGPGEFINIIRLETKNDKLYVLDEINSKVVIYNSKNGNYIFEYNNKGQLVGQFAEKKKNPKGETFSIFDNVVSIAADGNNTIYVAYWGQPYKIEKYDSQGKKELEFTKKLSFDLLPPGHSDYDGGFYPGDLMCSDISVTSYGLIFVACGGGWGNIPQIQLLKNPKTPHGNWIDIYNKQGVLLTSWWNKDNPEESLGYKIDVNYDSILTILGSLNMIIYQYKYQVGKEYVLSSLNSKLNTDRSASVLAVNRTDNNKAKEKKYRYLTHNNFQNRDAIWLADSKNIIYKSNRNGNYDLYMVNTENGKDTILMKTPLDEYVYGLIPNSDKILFENVENKVTVLKTYDLISRRTETLLKINEDLDHDCILSPNGKFIGFVSKKTDAKHIMLLNLRTKTVSSFPLDFPADKKLIFSWSPNMKYISYSLSNPGLFSTDGKIYLYDLNTNQTRILVDHAGYPLWSPDGKYFAYTILPGFIRAARIGIYNFKIQKGTKIFRKNSSDQWPEVWSPNSKWLIFTQKYKGNWAIWIVTPNNGNPELGFYNEKNLYSPRISPDGKKIVFERGLKSDNLCMIDFNGASS